MLFSMSFCTEHYKRQWNRSPDGMFLHCLPLRSIQILIELRAYSMRAIFNMTYQIQFFNMRIKTVIEAWPSGIAASFVRITEQITLSGPNLGMPYTKALGDGLFEIRARGAEGIGRAFFCCIVGRRVVILHGFIKKTQATPMKELELARKRHKEIRDA